MWQDWPDRALVAVGKTDFLKKKLLSTNVSSSVGANNSEPLLDNATMPHPPPDPLITACAQGNRRAQEAFYQAHSPKLLPIVLRYLGSRAEAVAVLNQAMLRIFQSLSEYREDGKLDAWLATIVRRTALNVIRDEGRASRRFQPKDFTPPASVPNTALGDLHAGDILKLLQALPDYLRIVFSLSVFDGLSHAEIAHELEITVAASRWRLSKARELLRTHYHFANRINESLL
jgi:RNA polymerase sigma-70 factor (ECF subfamily)